MELKLLNQYAQSPMNAEQVKLMAAFLMRVADPAAVEQELQSNFICQVLGKRLDYHHKEGEPSVSPEARLFCAYLCTGPGDAVLYAHTLHHLAAKGKQPYGVHELAKDFPNGFPNADERRKAWDAQKGQTLGLDCDNYLDLPEAWQI